MRLIPAEHKQSDGTGQPCIGQPGRINLCGQRIDRYLFGLGNMDEGLPERVFQGYACAMAAQSQGMFFGAAEDKLINQWGYGNDKLLICKQGKAFFFQRHDFGYTQDMPCGRAISACIFLQFRENFKQFLTRGFING